MPNSLSPPWAGSRNGSTDIAVSRRGRWRFPGPRAAGEYPEGGKALSGAKYVRFETFMDPAVAPGQKQAWYPWPYVEGLTIEEVQNELSFLATGIYGKPLPNQNGAPIRHHPVEIRLQGNRRSAGSPHRPAAGQLLGRAGRQ